MDTWYWCFGFAKKAFLSTIFHRIKVRPSIETNHNSRNHLYSFGDWVLLSCSPLWDTWYWCFGSIRENFLSTIFCRIKVHPSNETNLYSHNNLHFFVIGHYNHVPLIGIHDISVFGLARKTLLSIIFFIIKVCLSNEINLDSYNNLYFFCDWPQQSHFFSLGYMVLMLWFRKKSFSFHHFHWKNFVYQMGQTCIT